MKGSRPATHDSSSAVEQFMGMREVLGFRGSGFRV